MKTLLNSLVVIALLLAFAPAAQALPGCESSDTPGCEGCACEVCVCEMDGFCCEVQWDSICVSECVEDCGGCVELLNCGDGNCNPDEFENCTNCAEDCACAEGQECYQNECCAPACEGKNCGDDGCGGVCGECAAGEFCSEVGACEPIPPCDIVQPLHCDDVIEINNADGTSIIDQYDCVGWNESAPELGFSFDSEVDDLVIFTVEQTGEADLDIFLMEGSCTPDSCIDYGSTEVSIKVTPGAHYYVTVDGYNGKTGPGVLTVWCQSTCVPDCDGKMCGDDGCNGVCGECAGSCIDGLCHEGPGCEALGAPTCNGCVCEECVCAMDSYCCDTAWDSLCVSQCISDCGGCLDLANCGDGNCVLEDYETCANCPEDCACGEGASCYQNQCCEPACTEDNGCQDDGCGGICPCLGEDEICFDGACCTPFCDETLGCQSDGCGNICPCATEEEVCYQSECCIPSCDGKECGDDGCGGNCGGCAGGFYCNDNFECAEASCEGNCGGGSGYGCYCDESCFDYGDCCGDVCEFCPEVDATGQFCADLSNCGNGACDDVLGENCDNCPEDCACGNGEVCGVAAGAAGCVQDMCAEGATDMGCCYDGVLYACVDGVTYSLDCATLDNICGWYTGDWQYPAGYYCGPDDLIDTNGDPSGEHPMACVSCDPACLPGEKCVGGECVPCEPACEGKNCGDDGCGGLCGECNEGLECLAGVCSVPPVLGCEALDAPGCDGCPCEACVCEQDPYCCETQWDDICAGICVDNCGGCPEAEPFCGDMACNGDENCESCVEDCGCAADELCDGGECVPCEPACEGLECGDDGCGGSCGECDEGLDCIGGLCEEPCVPDCEGKSCGDDGCGGVCGQCAEDEECNQGVCEYVDPCGNGVIDDGEQCENDADCGTGAVCEECLCIIACVPDCDGKMCGDDGCEGSCGICLADETCDEAGQCVGGVQPDVVNASDLTAEDAIGGSEDQIAGADVAPEQDGSGDEDPKKKSGGCTTSGSQSPAAGLLLALALLALAGLRRQQLSL